MANWNRQGGSNRDNINKDSRKSRKNKTPANNAIDDLKQSNSTSFKLVIKKDKLADYGEFGTEVNWITDDLTDLEIDDDLTIPTNYNLVNPTRSITDNTRSDSDDYRINASSNITPYNLTDQYEIVVKYATNNLVLTIMSGQAYMARNDVNNVKFDYALVVVSTVDLKFGTNAPSKANAIIMGGNSSFKIIDSLYQWVRGKLAITSDSTGKSSDANLSAIPIKTVPELPDTLFTYQSIEHLLFGSGDGLKPVQICLSAIDKLLTFRSLTSYPSTTYDVLWIGERLGLCAKLGGEDENPNPNPVVDYRFIAVFVDGSQFAIGGFDAENHIESLVTSNQLLDSKIGFNIIDPNAVDWKGIKPRVSGSYPNHTQMYWQLSYLEKDFQVNTRVRVVGKNGAVVSSAIIDRADDFLFDWKGGNLWQSNLISSTLDLLNPVNENNPIVRPIDPRNDLFGYDNGGIDRFFTFIKSYLNPQLDTTKTLKRISIEGTNIDSRAYTASLVNPRIDIDNTTGDPDNDFTRTIIREDDVELKNNSGVIDFAVRSIERVDVFAVGTASGISGIPYLDIDTSTSKQSVYNAVELIINGQLQLLKIQSKQLSIDSAQLRSFKTEQGFFNSPQYSLRNSRYHPSEQHKRPAQIDYKIGTTALDMLPLILDATIDSATAINNIVDSESLNWALDHKYLSKWEKYESSIEESDSDTGNETRILTRDMKYELSKTRAYEQLESAHFVLISRTEIKNCQITSIIEYEQAGFAAIDDPTLYINNELAPIIEAPDYYVPRSPENNNSLFSQTTTATYSGFDADDPTNNPYDRARKIKKFSYQVLSTHAHDYMAIVPTGKLKMIFPSETYFGASNTILTKPAVTDSDIVARLFKSYRIASNKAAVEKWAVKTSGQIELLAIETSALGTYANPVTNNIYYYPG